MLNEELVTALIPARGGSQGVPDKNLRCLGTKSLVEIAVDAARQSRHVDRVVVNTDSRAIETIAKQAGVDSVFLRRTGLGGARTPMVDVVSDFVARDGSSGWIVLLQPTSPLREGRDIDAALELAHRSGSKSVVSMCLARSHPEWLWRVDERGKVRPYCDASHATRRQDLEPLYERNGAIFAFDMEWFAKTRAFSDSSTAAYVMPEERSIDIDSEVDLALAEVLFARRGERSTLE